VSTALEFCAGLPERHFDEGEFLVREGGATSGQLFFLAEGALEVLKGDDVSITVLSEPGAVVGEISVLLDGAYTASVRAIAPSRCFVAEAGLAFLAEKPEAALWVAQLLARRLYLVTTYLADLKRQYSEHDASLEMVDQVLDTLVHHHDAGAVEPGSDREREPNY